MQIVEKRKLERFDLNIPAKIQVVSGGEKEEMKLTTSNICSGGAFFRTTQPLPVGTEITIDLVLSLGKFQKLKDIKKQVSINLTGKVLHAETTGMGVCFDEEYQIFH